MACLDLYSGRGVFTQLLDVSSQLQLGFLVLFCFGSKHHLAIFIGDKAGLLVC